MSTTTVVHALTCWKCGSHDVKPGVSEWANCQACGKGMSLSEAMTCGCDGYDCVPWAASVPAPPEQPQYDEHGRYQPEPGTEYPFSVSDIARAAVRLLGEGWSAESGHWGVTGVVSGGYVTDFELAVDYQGDLVINFTHYEGDGLPNSPELPEGVKDSSEGVYLPDLCSADGLEKAAELCAAALRAVTGR